MTTQEHIERHKELHKAFDELLADFLQENQGSLSDTIEQLMRWSYEQMIKPNHCSEDTPNMNH